MHESGNENIQSDTSPDTRALKVPDAVRSAVFPIPRDELLRVEWFNHGTSHEVRAAVIRKHGTLEQNAGVPRDAWNHSKNTISLSRRVERDLSFAGRVDAALQTIHRYYEIVDSNAPMDCSDGRPSIIKGEHVPLGPKSFAGSFAPALARHLTEPEVSGTTLSEDVAAAMNELSKHGIKCGGHVDERYGVVEGCTGCAGIDRIELIFEKLSDSRLRNALGGAVYQTLGKQFSRAAFKRVSERIRGIDPHTYFGNGHKEKIIKVMEDTARNAHQPVDTRAGEHNEVALVMNLVEGTTLNQTKFSNDNSGEIQVFNFDLWEVFATADALYPEDTVRRNDYIAARAKLFIATAMVISDGSLKLLVRSERDDR